MGDFCIVADGDGNQLATEIASHDGRATAQRIANERREVVYLFGLAVPAEEFAPHSAGAIALTLTDIAALNTRARHLLELCRAARENLNNGRHAAGETWAAQRVVDALRLLTSED